MIETLLTKWVNKHNGKITFDTPKHIPGFRGYTLCKLYMRTFGRVGLCAAVKMPDTTMCDGLFSDYIPPFRSAMFDACYDSVKWEMMTTDNNLF